MSKLEFFEDDIAIVSFGAVLPDAANPQEFWQNLMENKCSIKPISDDRWKKDLHYSPYRELSDKTYSHYGAEISTDLNKKIMEKNGLDEKSSSRLDVMAIEATRQALSEVKMPQDRKRVCFILGLMNPDESFYFMQFQKKEASLLHDLLQFYPEDQQATVAKIFRSYTQKHLSKFEPSLDNLLVSATIRKLQDRFQVLGNSFCVDAACASSLASIDLARKRLANNEIDMALVGGLESNLSPGAYTLFSKVGALAVQRCLPMDQRSDGLSQGEGAVIFVLQRLADAKRDRHQIHGIIKSCEGSSDGRVTSLFQPSLVGQSLAYSRAYKKFADKHIDYLELHGTGTKVGDAAEAQSVALFFNEIKIPMGSTKFLIGHTKSTAGATGLLRCLLSMKTRTIPKSGYFEKPVITSLSQLFINKTDIKLSPRRDNFRMGVSAFGFGGCNYHLVVDSYPENAPILARSGASKKNRAMVLLSEVNLAMSDFDGQWFLDKDAPYRVPPKSLVKIDRTQLLAVKAVDLAMRKINLSFDRLNREQISVVSASTIGLDIIHQMAMRMTMDTLIESAKHDSKFPPEARLAATGPNISSESLLEFAKNVEKLKDHYEPLNEDSGPGVLNNVIAGRVCNAFNLKGSNFNIDCDQASIACALSVLQTEIELGLDQLTILVGVHESIEASSAQVKRHGVSCYLLCSEEFAKNEMLPIHAKFLRQPMELPHDHRNEISL